MRDRKLIILAFDGADSGLAQKWSGEGQLPVLAKLFKTGVVAPIATPPAVLEGAVWPTFYSGATAATHGMYAYLQIAPGTYDTQLGLRADRLRVPPFWEHLSRAGKRVAVVDAPLTKPSRRLNGIQIVNWGAHDAEWSWKQSSWPSRLMGDVLERFGQHPAPKSCNTTYPNRSLEDFEDLRRRLIDGVKAKARLLKYCLELENWDFFFGVFSESHCMGHQFWHFMDPNHPRHDPEAPLLLRSAIRDVYAAIDSEIGAILERVASETDVLILLSHGMGPYYHGSHLLEEILERLGVNSAKGSVPFTANKSVDNGASEEWIWRARHLLPDKLRQRVKTRVPRNLMDSLWAWSHPEPNPWPRMRAFVVPASNMSGAIRINLKGREPNGLVEPGSEYQNLCAELKQALTDLKNPDTGKTAVQWVARSDEFFSGPRLSELPDLFVEWDHSAPITTLTSPKVGIVHEVSKGQRSGSHWPGGLLIGCGPGFVSGLIAERCQTSDIAPTILDYFGVPPPQSYEGRSLLPFL